MTNTSEKYERTQQGNLLGHMVTYLWLLAEGTPALWAPQGSFSVSLNICLYFQLSSPNMGHVAIKSKIPTP